MFRIYKDSSRCKDIVGRTNGRVVCVYENEWKVLCVYEHESKGRICVCELMEGLYLSIRMHGRVVFVYDSGRVVCVYEHEWKGRISVCERIFGCMCV